MSAAELRPEATSAGELAAISAELSLQGKSCQLIEGELRMMSPAGGFHGALAADIASLLTQHAKRAAIGRCFGAETGFLISRNPDTVLAPDAAFVSNERLEAVGLGEGYFPEAPALAVEIVSPGDTAEAVDDKARRWLAAGTRMVWVVYPKRETLTVYRSADNVRLLSAEDSLEGADVVPGFSVKVAELFAGLK